MYKVSLSRPIDLVNVQKEVDERRWLKEKKKGPVQRDPNHLNSLVKLVEVRYIYELIRKIAP
jgi:hypothetical protein